MINMNNVFAKAPGVMAALLVLAVTIANANNQRPSTEPAAVREIRRVLERQVEAWNRQDIEGFMKGYWRSPDLTFYSGGTTVAGWEETLGRYRKRYLSAGNEMGKLEFKDLKIEVLGPNAAFVRGRFHLNMNNGQSDGVFTLTFKRFADGWKIIHDHTSTA